MSSVWEVHLNKDTRNFGGSEWVVDGEDGRNVYPGTWEKEKAVRYYRNGWDYDHPGNNPDDGQGYSVKAERSLWPR